MGKKKKKLFGLTKRLKVLIFFFFVPKCNVKQMRAWRKKVRYMESKVMVSIMYIDFNGMFLLNFYVLFPGMIISLRCSM